MSQRTHLDPDRLADLHEGLLDPAATSAAEEHLADCPTCSADLETIAGLPERLAGAADVGPTPDDVVRRVDRALADAAAEGSAARTITPLADRHRSAPRGMRVLQAAAVIVVLLAGSALAVSAIDGGDSNSGATKSVPQAGSAGGGRSESQSFRLTVSGRDWTAQTLAAAVPQMANGTFGPSDSLAGAPSPSAGDGSQDRADSGLDGSISQAPAARLAGGPALAACVGQLAGGPATPLAVDLGKYGGKPAAVVLLPTLGEPDRVDVWVVSPECSASDAHLLYFARVPRS